MKKKSKENKPATFTAIIKVNMIINEPKVKAKANNHNGRQEERKISLRANQNSKLNQPNCLKRGKTRASKSWLLFFASDWLKDWWQFSGPIAERSKAKPVQSQITFDTQLKNCSIVYVFLLLVRRG